MISPIGQLRFRGVDYPINGGAVGDLSQRLYDALYGMQTGIIEPEMDGWVVTI